MHYLNKGHIFFYIFLYIKLTVKELENGGGQDYFIYQALSRYEITHQRGNMNSHGLNLNTKSR